MSKGLNQVFLIGHVGQDCEMSTTKNGNALVNFSMATGLSIKDANEPSGYKEKTSWHQLSAFGKTAESIAKFATKGSKLWIEGHLDYYKYTKDDRSQTIVKIIVKEFIVLSSTASNHESAELGNAVDQRLTVSKYLTPALKDNSSASGVNQFDDDIPF